MAIYHFSVKNISRNGGRSAVAAAAYILGEKLFNEQEGKEYDYSNRNRSATAAAAYISGNRLTNEQDEQTHDFSAKGGIIHSEVMLPENAKSEYADPSVLWNTAEKSEKNANARTAREIVVALPIEFSDEQKIKFLQRFVKEMFVEAGMCAGFSIHAGKHKHQRDEENKSDVNIKPDNPHAHILLTVRPLDKNGDFCTTKSRKEYILDKDGNRIKLSSGEWKSRKINLVDWNDKEMLEKWRREWANAVNKELERIGVDKRIDHRTLKEQGIDREPQIHIGVAAKEIERRGEVSERARKNGEIIERNRQKELDKIAQTMHEYKRGYVALDKEVSVLERENNNIEHEIRTLKQKSGQMSERAEYIQRLNKQIDELKREREGMGFFKNKEKKELDRRVQMLETSYNQAVNSFEKNYSVKPDQSEAMAKQLEYKAQNLKQSQEEIKNKLTPLVERKESFEMWYKRQVILLEISPNCQAVQERLKRLNEASPVNVRRLETITQADFEKVTAGLKPEQVREFIRRREQEKTRGFERAR